MMARRTPYTPSRARCQAQAALARGRHTRRHDHPGEIPGQMSIEDALADLADVDQEQASGGERS